MTRRACVLAAVLLLAAVSAAPAQRAAAPAPELSEFLEGTHAFRRILYDGTRRKLQPLEAPEQIADPATTLIVVLGDPSPLNAVNKWLAPPDAWPMRERGLLTFIRRGGAVLIATDHKTPPFLTQDFNVAVTGDVVEVPPGYNNWAYRGMKECPFVHPLNVGEPDLFSGRPVGRGQPPLLVASNVTSCLGLGNFPPGLHSLAIVRGTPKDRWVDRNSWPFAVGGDLGAGRVLILADKDVFINEMMLQDDNGNIDFAYRCADWLLARSDGQPGRRNQVLYYEEGVVQSKFDIQLKDVPPPPLPPPDTLMGLLDETMNGMEQEGFFAQLEEDNVLNQTVDDLMGALPFWEGSRPQWKIWTLAVILVSVALGIYGFVRLGTFRHRSATAGPLLTTLLEQQTPASAVLQQRQEELLRDGNLWEAARELARQLFVSAGVSLDTTAAPTLAVSGSWWRRWRLPRLWQQLWLLARSARPMRVSRRGFARLTARVEALRADLAGGTVRIIP
jgi:hypothetical protein